MRRGIVARLLAGLWIAVAMSGCLFLVDLEGLSRDPSPSSAETGTGADTGTAPDGGDAGAKPDALSTDGQTKDVNADADGSVARSCKDLRGAGVTTDGYQRIDADGTGPLPAFDVYCEMTTDGGGWTLVARTVLNRSGNFGWHIARGSVSDDTEPYSLGDASLALNFTELLLAARSGTGKAIGNNAYKLAVSAADLTANEDAGISSYAISTVKGTCSPAGGPTMLRFAGHASRSTVYFFRDNDVLDDDYGLDVRGFDTVYNDCPDGADLHNVQGMLFVR